MRSDLRLFFATAIAVIITFICAGTALASPPANDNFANAQNLNINLDLTTGDNTQATKEPGEPNHAGNPGGRSVWYKYTPVTPGTLTIQSAGFDTLLAVYQGASVGSLVLLSASDNVAYVGGGGGYSEVGVGVQAGVTYYIAVDGAYHSSSGSASGTISLNYEFSATPPNDNFATIPTYQQLYTGTSYARYAVTNLNAGKEAGEPNHAGNVGGKSVWFKLGPVAQPTSFQITVEGTSVSDPSTGVTTLLAVYQGTALANLLPYTSTIATAGHTGRVTVSLSANQTYYVAIDGFNSGSGAATGNFLLSVGGNRTRREPDLNRDGSTEISIFRPSTGVWYSLDTNTGTYRSFQWGQNGDAPLFNHLDDDDRPDYTAFRPSTGIWHLLRSFDNSYAPVQWGLSGDVPFLINEYKSGTTNCYQAVFRPSSGTWYIRGANNPSFQFGQAGDIPVVADFNGDGTDEVAVFRPSNGVWYIGHPFNGAPYSFTQFGMAGDKPVAADYDGDGRADVAVYRPSNGTWYILESKTGMFRAVQFGNSTDIPQPADYDNYGSDEIAVFRPSTGTWYIRPDFLPSHSVQFGQAGDIPVSAPIFGGN